VRLRVAAYNVRSFRSGSDEVAGALEPEAPDVVLIQECGSRRAIRRFAASLGMEFASSHRLFNRVRNAVLYRPEWHLAGVDVRDLSRQGRTLRRGLIAVHLRTMGVRLTAVSLHLGLAPGERERHARELTDLLAGIPGRIVVGADLNEGPGEPAARWISERLYDLFLQAGVGAGETFPASAPAARIDFVFGGEGVKAIEAWVPSTPAVAAASDHRPVVAEVDVQEP
jgi:endonuclease/exonuclease/phosphatase family metal-dependent hydrolase